MSNHCKLIPDAPNGKPSKLFADLQAHIHDRSLVKQAWGFTKTDLFKSQFGDLEKDENGEITYRALSNILNLDMIFNDTRKEWNRALDNRIIKSDGSAVKYDRADVALSKANEFNKSFAYRYIVVVRQEEDGKYSTNLENNTALAIAEADRNVSRQQLNTALISILQKAGFNVDFANDITYYGVFNPLLAEDNADNLKTVIQIANNEKGLEALPEEVAHLILAGLKNHPLKIRLDSICTDNVVKRILGEQYEEYYDMYKGGQIPVEERLREEAEGKLFASILRGNTDYIVDNSKINISKDEYTDEFRELQKTSNNLTQGEIRSFQRGDERLTKDQQQNLGAIYERLLAKGLRGRDRIWINLNGKGNNFKVAQVNGELFKDIFSINRNYLKNGELVDLHESYDNCKCYLTSDGLSGFAIEPDGNLVSVFSLNPAKVETKRGFLYAIAPFVNTEGATHLDAYVSDNQNLEEIYKKTLGFNTASRMDYNMDYDHDNIAKNHGMPDVVFMVNNNDVAERHFSKDEYEAASRYASENIKNKKSNSVKESVPLIKRIWGTAKDKIKTISEEDIDNAIIAAENAIHPIVDMIKSGEISTVLDKEQIKKHEKLYDLADKTEKLAEMAQDGETLLSKKLYILQNTQTDVDTKQLRSQIISIRKSLENQHYAAACYQSLHAIGKDIRELMGQAAKLGSVYNNSTDLNVISSEAGILSRMSSAVQAYTGYLSTLSQLPTLIKRGDITMEEEWATPIVSLANEYLSNLRTMKEDIGQLRFSVLKQLISLYYGDMGQKPEGFEESETVKWQSVDMILSKAKQDISWFDANLFSAGDSRNPLLNVIHNIVVSQQAKRNNKINKFCMKMQEADAKLRNAGYDSKFIYDTNENGIPTGYYVAPVDFARFDKERQTYVDSVMANEELTYYEQQKLITKWEDEHLEDVEVGKPINIKGERRTERMPKKSIYGIIDFQKGWSAEQKEYYNAILDMKAEMDNMLPVGMQHLYLAPQVRKSITQAFDRNGRGAAGMIWNKWKKDFSVIEDNDEYGADASAKNKQYVLLDFAGKPIKRVPTYYTKQLDDMRDLSTDSTHSMFSYIAMAVNFSEMGQLANAMRLMQEHVNSENFEVVQTNGGKTIVDMFKSLGRTYGREYTKTGEGTRVVQAINEYIDRQFFNETKEVIGDISLTENHKLNGDVMFNVFMKLTSIGRMGFNVLSGITNATQGETQMICEAAANRYFNIKDLSWSKKEYGKLLFDYMGNFNSADRHDKMYMLINQFNSSEDFFRDMKDKDFNKSAMKRVMGRGNVYFLNTMGEHYLHTSGMLAVLKHEKVKRVSDPNKEVSLYDVIKQVHDENGWHLELDSDITFVDRNKAFLQDNYFAGKDIIKKEDRDKLFENLSVYINNINAGMHGGYSEAEKGNANRQALWRALLQFRQWMFGMYNKMYSRPYYDAAAKKMKEGGYYSMYKFVTGVLHDLKTMTFKKAIENNHLTYDERKNVNVAMAQALLFIVLTSICTLTKGWKDKDDRSTRLLAYQMRRLEMETGALVPFPPTFIKNVFTLIQSPAAGVKTLEGLSQMFDFAHLAFWSENSYIKSGRFKGWWKPFKAAWTASPIYNIQRLIDMDDYNYMFNIFGD